MDYDILIPAQVFIEQVEQVVVRDNHIYAQTIKLKLTNEIFLEAEDLNGLDVAEYEKKEAECLIEIIEAEFLPPKISEEDEPDPTILELEYLGYLPACYFFPPPDDTVKRDGKLDALLYESALQKQFSAYSKAGFPLEAFETQPLFQMGNGTALLFNKAIFDKKLKAFIQNSKVLVKPLDARLLSVASPRTLPTKEELEERKQERAARFKAKKSRWNIFN